MVHKISNKQTVDTLENLEANEEMLARVALSVFRKEHEHTGQFFIIDYSEN